jgi:hypothetical protein
LDFSFLSLFSFLFRISKRAAPQNGKPARFSPIKNSASMSGTSPLSSDVQGARDAYMQHFSSVFEDELLAVYEAEGGSTEAVRQLTACIEVGVAVWGFPLVLPDPTAP